MQKVEREYIVEKILEKKKFRNEFKYKVKWLGYPESQSTWEPKEHLSKCVELIEEYEKSQNQNQTHNQNQNKSPLSSNSNNIILNKPHEKKLIGKKRKIQSDSESIEEIVEKSSVESKKETIPISSNEINVLKNSIKNNPKSSNENDEDTNSKNSSKINQLANPNKLNISKLSSINSITSQSSEQINKEFSIKSPEKLKYIETINNEFATNITSPRISTRNMLKKSEDDKIIENVYEK
jgi:hypothetical protein